MRSARVCQVLFLVGAVAVSACGTDSNATHDPTCQGAICTGGAQSAGGVFSGGAGGSAGGQANTGGVPTSSSGGVTESGGSPGSGGTSVPGGATSGTGGATSGGTTGGSGGQPTSGVSLRWESPAPDTKLTGTVEVRLTGNGFLNVEILRDGARIASCTVAANHESATCPVTTTQLPNGSVTLTAHAWDSPAGQPYTNDADAGPRTFTIDNPRPPVTKFAEFTGVCAYLESDFPIYRSLGIKHLRMDHPDAGLIERARTFGIEVLPIADYGFEDLSGNDWRYPPLPQNRGEWARRMVDKWRGMKNPPKVIEVWNEPWVSGFWMPGPDAPAYLELVKAFAREAWAVWPNLTILVSADTDSAPAGYLFRDELLRADREKFLNDRRILPTTHNYVQSRYPLEVTAKPCTWDLKRYECAYDAFKAHGHPDPQVWITEFGWESQTAGGNTSFGDVTEQQQADYVNEALQIFRSSGKVAKAYGFMLRSDDPWNYNWLRPNNSQKPVCGTIKQLLTSGN